MKLKVLPKKTFDDWARSSQISRLDIRKLHSADAEVFPHEIAVSPTTRISDVIRLIVGEEPITDLRQQGSSSARQDTPENTSNIGEKIRWDLYCLQASRISLEHAKPLNAYDIQDGDILLFTREIIIPRERMTLGGVYIKDVDDFCRRIIGANYIAQALAPDKSSAREPFKYLNWEGVLLYTEADFELSKYVRYNFPEPDKLIGDSLRLYFIEQPTLLNGISTREYWRAYLEESSYSILHALGFTKNKPYNKIDAYEIAEMLGVLPQCLPCLVLFDRITSQEKIVITLLDNYTLFFRILSSTLKRVKAVLMKYQEPVYNQTTERQKKFMEDFKKSFRVIDLSPCNGIKDPIERSKAKEEMYRQMRNTGALTKSEFEKKAREMYESSSEYWQERASINSFEAFKREFLREWKRSQNMDIVDVIYRSEQRERIFSYTFQGDTVFINKPEAPFELNDFQKGGSE
jgi:hypothetical protein